MRGFFGVPGTDIQGDPINTRAVVQPEKDSPMTTIIPVEYPTQEDLDRLALLGKQRKHNVIVSLWTALIVLPPLLLSVVGTGLASSNPDTGDEALIVSLALMQLVVTASFTLVIPVAILWGIIHVIVSLFEGRGDTE
jgi:hypothetical protein